MSTQPSYETSHSNRDRGARPDLTLVMPCYNEQEIVEYTIRRLLGAFRRAGYELELIAVDNGSRDRTGEIIQSLAAQDPSIVPHRVEVNQGYGFGVLSGFPLACAPWIGIIPADGQVDAEDAVRLYETVVVAGTRTLGKVRRRFRMDGMRRKVVSVAYNLLVRLLWPRLDSWDINGTPKILAREVLVAMDLKSKGWLLDPEIMIKAYYMGIRVLELNVFARMRSSGVSHVRPAAIWEFVRYLLRFRFSRAWQQDFREPLRGLKDAAAESGPKTSDLTAKRTS
jgi:glycosyltransferase involved in cell wall biosynthesis